MPELAAREAPLQIAPAPVVTPPPPTPDLRPTQQLAIIPPPAPAVAPRAPPLEINAPPTVPLQAAAPQLRPQQRLDIAEPEPPPPVIAPRAPPLQLAAPAPVTQRDTPPDLRPAQRLELAESEPAPPAIAPRAPPLQINAPASVNRAVAPPALRPGQRLAGNPAGSGQPAGQDGALASAGSGAGAPAAVGSASGGGQSASVSGAGSAPHPGCALEHLLLLTPEEQVRCRNELDNLAARRANRFDPAEGSRRLQQALGGPQIDRIPPERRAYFNAVAAARDARNTVGGGRPPGLSCNLSSLFGGTAGLTRERIKIPGLPCVFVPPTGALTEESRLTPP
jgi:hypothetical protein